MSDLDDCQLKAEIDDIMKRVKDIMSNVESLDTNQNEEVACNEGTPGI